MPFVRKRQISAIRMSVPYSGFRQRRLRLPQRAHADRLLRLRVLLPVRRLQLREVVRPVEVPEGAAR